MSEDVGASVVYVTAPAEEAPALARALVERRLAACVNLIPGIRSFYRWEGKVQDDPEVLLVIKTQASRLPALADAVSELHSYSVPEVLSMPVSFGAAAYLDWVRESVEGA